MFSQWFIILNSNPETRCQRFCSTNIFDNPSFLPWFNFTSVSYLNYSTIGERERGKKVWHKRLDKRENKPTSKNIGKIKNDIHSLNTKQDKKNVS